MEVLVRRGNKWNTNDVLRYEHKPMFPERDTTLLQAYLLPTSALL
jgi:hypothetical protein